MLVIYAKEFGESLKDFLHFKRMSGLTVETASYDANGGGDLRDTAEIRQYVKRQYEAKGMDLRYVLLVGSFKKLPSERYEGVKKYAHGERLALLPGYASLREGSSFVWAPAS